MGKLNHQPFERRDRAYLRGKKCAFLWGGEAPMPNRADMRRCGNPAEVGIPCRMEGDNLVPYPSAIAEGVSFFCEAHWAVARPQLAGDYKIVRAPDETEN